MLTEINKTISFSIDVTIECGIDIYINKPSISRQFNRNAYMKRLMRRTFPELVVSKCLQE
jgi:hypothetical protein